MKTEISIEVEEEFAQRWEGCRAALETLQGLGLFKMNITVEEAILLIGIEGLEKLVLKIQA